MSRLRSGPLAAWTGAHLAGAVDAAAVVAAVTGGDRPHRVDGAGLAGAGLRDALDSWRRAGTPVRLVLPVPGDVRGLAGPAAFRAAALDAGEAVAGGGLGLVPQVTDFAPSSAPAAVVWRAFATEPAPPDYLPLADARYELTTAVRECATALTAADVAGGSGCVADDLRDARRAGDRLNLPPGFPPDAVALLAQAVRLAAVADLAARDPVGGAVDRAGMAARADALRPLAAAVRRARVAGYNALAGPS